MVIVLPGPIGIAVMGPIGTKASVGSSSGTLSYKVIVNGRIRRRKKWGIGGKS